MNNVTSPRINGKTIIVLAFLLVIGVATFLAVYLAQSQTNNRSKAAASTTLSFTPSTVSVGVGQAATADVQLDPGNNQVSVMKLVITYDGSKFDKNSANIIPNLINPSSPNAQGFIQILEPFSNSCNGTKCSMSITESVGSQANLVITQPLKVASVSLTALTQTDSSGTSVTVDPSSQVFSLAPSDQASENVLQFSSLIPLTVTIGNTTITPTPPVCAPDQSTCSWGTVSGASSYNFVVTDVGTGVVVKQGSVQAPTTSIQFSSTPGHTYNCSVTVTNACGATSNPGQATKTCPLSPTPTPTSCPTPGAVQNLHLSCPGCTQ